MNPAIVEFRQRLAGFNSTQVLSHVARGPTVETNPPHTLDSGLTDYRRVVTGSLHDPADHSSPEIPQHTKYSNVTIRFGSLLNL